MHQLFGRNCFAYSIESIGRKQYSNSVWKPTGVFAHNPEPLPEHLEELCHTVKNTRADVGFAVDPDVDRLAIVQENGEVFGEEYTLVAVAKTMFYKIKRQYRFQFIFNQSTSNCYRKIRWYL